MTPNSSLYPLVLAIFHSTLPRNPHRYTPLRIQNRHSPTIFSTFRVWVFASPGENTRIPPQERTKNQKAPILDTEISFSNRPIDPRACVIDEDNYQPHKSWLQPRRWSWFLIYPHHLILNLLNRHATLIWGYTFYSDPGSENVLKVITPHVEACLLRPQLLPGWLSPKCLV